MKNMLERTFIHIPKVGPATELRLWQTGIMDWHHACECRRPPRGFSSNRWRQLQDFCEQSRRHLWAGEYRPFARSLPAREHWRAWPDFRQRCAYLDIETTGLGPWAQVTVVGLYDGLRVHTYIAGENLDLLPERLAEFTLLVTFNGATFDLPILRRCFPGLPLDQLHVDLRYLLRRLGFVGGLKHIERRLGLARDDDIADLDGFDAVRLWHEYRAGSEEALQLLVKYNAADIQNLEPLMEMAYERSWARLARPLGAAT